MNQSIRRVLSQFTPHYVAEQFTPEFKGGNSTYNSETPEERRRRPGSAITRTLTIRQLRLLDLLEVELKCVVWNCNSSSVYKHSDKDFQIILVQNHIIILFETWACKQKLC